MEVYVSIVILLVVMGSSFAPGAARNAVKLIDQTPLVLDRLSTRDIASDLRSKYGWSDEQEFRLRFFLAKHKQQIQHLILAVDRYLSNTALLLGWLLLVPILAIFFLRDGDHIANVLVDLLFPRERRATMRATAHELHLMLTRYIRAQVASLWPFFLVLFRGPAPSAISPRHLVGLFRRITGIHSGGWLDQHIRSDCRRRYCQSLALALYGGVVSSLASDPRLSCNAPDHGAAAEDSSFGRDLCGAGRHRTRRNYRHLSRGAGDGGAPCDLAHACRRRTRTRLLSLRRCLRGCAAYSRRRRNRVNQSMPTVPVIYQGLGYLPFTSVRLLKLSPLPI